MMRFVTSLLLCTWLLPVIAEDAPATGRLLVANDEVHGEVFKSTVILLLYYGEDGAMGLVVNRPTDVELEEVVDNVEIFGDYRESLYWGGPVQMEGMLALALVDTQPGGKDAVVGSVYAMPVIEALQADARKVRLYLGYAGWAAGQLDEEMARGSWRVVPASDERVFTEKPRDLWQRLQPQPPQYRAAVK